MRVWHGNGWGMLEWGGGQPGSIQTLRQHPKSSLLAHGLQPAAATLEAARALLCPPHSPTISRLTFGFASILLSSRLGKVSGEPGWFWGPGSKIHVGFMEATEGHEGPARCSYGSCQEG